MCGAVITPLSYIFNPSFGRLFVTQWTTAKGSARGRVSSKSFPRRETVPGAGFPRGLSLISKSLAIVKPHLLPPAGSSSIMI